MEEKRRVAFIVPAHNEEKVIAETLASLLLISDAQDIYVGNDNSTDNTSSIANTFTSNVHDQHPNVGKATILNTLIDKYDLISRYEYIMPVDADTRITPTFIEETVKTLDADTEKKIICAVGKVVGKNASWVTSYRIWEYEIGQLIYKRAQSIINTILVCPGCATLYRASIFEAVKFPTGTVTEDTDLTLQIHRKKLGRIVFIPKAVVITQDPNTLREYTRQVTRWYKGFWQAVVKHDFPWGGQLVDLQVLIMATEGLFNGLLMIVLLALIPFLVLSQSAVMAYTLMADFFFFLIPTMLYVAFTQKLWRIFLYIPHFYIMRILASILFLTSFVGVLRSAITKEGWNSPTRYKVTV